MPWGVFARAKESDLKAVYRFLTQNVKPVRNKIEKTVLGVE